ncbi:hypothetical protein BH11PSE14_BH11PSE14_07560 [soil metagenome]
MQRSMIAHFMLGLFATIALAVPSESKAIRSGDYWNTAYECSVGYTIVEGTTISTKYCWTTYYLVEGGTYDGSEFTRAYDWIAGGGGSWGLLSAKSVPGYDDLKVNAAGTRAWTSSMGCADIEELKASFAQAAAAYAQSTAGTIYPVGHRITLNMGEGSYQVFVKISGSSSIQYGADPTGTCHNPTP